MKTSRIEICQPKDGWRLRAVEAVDRAMKLWNAIWTAAEAAYPDATSDEISKPTSVATNKICVLGPGLYRKKPVIVSAVQWFKNGDCPVVRYYRRPDDPGYRMCEKCSRTMSEHGWIDTLEGGHIVCPGDWIITGVKGEMYPCKPDIFTATYEPVARQHFEAMTAPNRADAQPAKQVESHQIKGAEQAEELGEAWVAYIRRHLEVLLARNCTGSAK